MNDKRSPPAALMAQQGSMFTERIIELQRMVFALATALTNQPGIDRPRLSQDFVTAFRAGGGDPDRADGFSKAVLTVLRTPQERNHSLSLGEKLLRSSAARPDEAAGYPASDRDEPQV